MGGWVGVYVEGFELRKCPSNKIPGPSQQNLAHREQTSSKVPLQSKEW